MRRVARARRKNEFSSRYFARHRLSVLSRRLFAYRCIRIIRMRREILNQCLDHPLSKRDRRENEIRELNTPTLARVASILFSRKKLCGFRKLLTYLTETHVLIVPEVTKKISREFYKPKRDINYEALSHGALICGRFKSYSRIKFHYETREIFSNILKLPRPPDLTRQGEKFYFTFEKSLESHGGLR